MQTFFHNASFHNASILNAKIFTEAKRIFALSLCFMLLLCLFPFGNAKALTPPPPWKISFTEADIAAAEERGVTFSPNEDVTAEVVQGELDQDGDGFALKVQHIPDSINYMATPNGVRVTFENPLPRGGTYTFSAWIYIPSDDINTPKASIKWGNILINGNSASDDHKHPTSGSVPAFDTWHNVLFTTKPFPEDIDFIEIRFYGNTYDDVPDLWYLDNIEITMDDHEELEVVERNWDLTLPSLAERYAPYFLLGNIMSAGQTEEEDTTAMFNHHYNAVTAENDMKPLYMSPSEGNYNFASADKIVDWAEANGIAVIGHTLVWHSQSAPWLTTLQGGAALTRSEARANMEEYIKNVAGRYAGRITAWDVVNEAFTNSASWSGDWKEGLRMASGNSSDPGSPWYAAYENGADVGAGESGADFIYDAFKFARQYDPNATLYYNDFNDLERGKSQNIAAMVVDLNTQWESDPDYDGRLLIEGIGLQSHHGIGGFSANELGVALERYASTGAVLSITELDFTVGGAAYPGGDTLSPEDAIKQATVYAQFFSTLLEYSDHIERVTIWGKTDLQSWRGNRLPLPFDTTFAAKEAFYAIIAPDVYLEGGLDAVIAAIAAGTVDGDGGSGGGSDSGGDGENGGGANEAPAPDTGDGDTSGSSLGALEIGLIIGIVCFVVIVVVVVIVVGKKKK